MSHTVHKVPSYWMHEDIPVRHAVITGSRKWSDEGMVRGQISWVLRRRSTYQHPISTVLRIGDAKGVDQMAFDWATGIPHPHYPITAVQHEVWRFKADWDEHGKKAGILRNLEMIQTEPLPHFGIAFKHGDESRGTDHCINAMRMEGIPVYVFQVLA